MSVYLYFVMEPRKLMAAPITAWLSLESCAVTAFDTRQILSEPQQRSAEAKVCPGLPRSLGAALVREAPKMQCMGAVFPALKTFQRPELRYAFRFSSH
jgi:hypothetical protein